MTPRRLAEVAHLIARNARKDAEGNALTLEEALQRDLNAYDDFCASYDSCTKEQRAKIETLAREELFAAPAPNDGSASRRAEDGYCGS